MGEQLKTVNPVVFTAVTTYAVPCRVMGIVWVGVGSLADTVSLDKLSGVASPPLSGLLWKGLCSIVNNYTPMTFGPFGIHCPYGFQVTQISSGTLLVYLMES